MRASILRDGDEMRPAAEVDGVGDDHRGGDEGLVLHAVGRQHFEAVSHPQDNDVTLFGCEVELAVGTDGRGLEIVRLRQDDQALQRP